jgi:hypothetical protein
MKHVPSQSSETLAETWRKKREYILNFKINIEWKWLKLVTLVFAILLNSCASGYKK